MLCNFLNLPVLIVVLLRPPSLKAIPIDWRSSMNLSSPGLLFSPIDLSALFLLSNTLPSLLSCACLCHSNGQCHIFDYDPQSRQCRLFQGDIATMGSLTMSPSLQSRVGSMKIDASQFLSFGQACSSCVGSRYLRCVNSTCQCPMNTFFDGLICQSQKLMGDRCGNNSECRSDLNHTCQLSMKCGEGSSAAVSIVAGLANGTSGNSPEALSTPLSIALDGDQSLYVSDYDNHRVIKLLTGSLLGSTVAGTGVAGSGLDQLNRPTGVFVDASFNLYVVDSLNYRVMLWQRNASFGIKVAGSGSQGNTLSSFAFATGLYVDSHGCIYLCDSGNHRVIRWVPNATNSVIVAGTGVAGGGSQKLSYPFGIDFDEANSYLYVADYVNHRIQRFAVNVSLDGATVAGGNGAGSGADRLDSPYAVYASRTSNYIYVTDYGNNRIQKWISQASSGMTVIGSGSTIANYSVSIQGPADIKLSFNEDFIFFSEATLNRVWRFKTL